MVKGAAARRKTGGGFFGGRLRFPLAGAGWGPYF
jgi:hypothetical protein